jgi:hypothetical protein
MDPLLRVKMQRKLSEAISAEKKHKENIGFQQIKLIEAQRLLDRSKDLLKEATARRALYENLLGQDQAE